MAVLLTATALCVPALRADGGIGPDGASYVQAGWWFATTASREVPAATATGRATFAVWPPGYPTLLALPMAAGSPPWWAARAVAVACLLAATLLLHALLKPQRADLQWWPLLPTLAIWQSTGAEAPFVVAMLALAWCLAKLARTNQVRFAWLAASAVTAAFTMRYIGVALCATLWISAALHARDGGRRRAAHLVGASLLPLAVAAATLAANQQATGFATGMPRLPAPESTLTWLAMLARGLVTEAVLAVPLLSVHGAWIAAVALALATQALVLAWLWGARPRLHLNHAAIACANVGGVYLISVIGTRWLRHFDTLGWRLLGPGTALCLAALIASMRWTSTSQAARWAKAGWVLAMVSMLTAVALAWHEPGTQQSTLRQVRHRFHNTPTTCLVGSPRSDIRWVRPELAVVAPQFPPYFAHAESFKAFTRRLQNSTWRCIRIEFTPSAIPKGADASWHALVRDHPDGAFMVIR